MTWSMIVWCQLLVSIVTASIVHCKSEINRNTLDTNNIKFSALACLYIDLTVWKSGNTSCCIINLSFHIDSHPALWLVRNICKIRGGCVLVWKRCGPRTVHKVQKLTNVRPEQKLCPSDWPGGGSPQRPGGCHTAYHRQGVSVARPGTLAAEHGDTNPPQSFPFPRKSENTKIKTPGIHRDIDPNAVTTVLLRAF